MPAPSTGPEGAPKIEHTPPLEMTRGEPLVLRARITTLTGRAVFEPFAYLRLPGLSGFTRIPLKSDGILRDIFTAEIAAQYTDGDLDYYLEAFDEDGNGPARVGSPEVPFHVKATAPAASDVPRASPQPAVAPPPAGVAMTYSPAPAPEKKSSAGTVALIVIASVLVLLGGSTAVWYEVKSTPRALGQVNAP